MGIRTIDNSAYLTHSPLRKLVDGAVTTNLIAERSQRYVWQAFLRKIDQLSQGTRQGFVVRTVLLGLHVAVAKVGEASRKV